MKRRPPLSPRQREIIRKIAAGCADKQISLMLGISEGTLKNHMSRIFSKLKAKSRAHAVFIYFSQ